MIILLLLMVLRVGWAQQGIFLLESLLWMLEAKGWVRNHLNFCHSLGCSLIWQGSHSNRAPLGYVCVCVSVSLSLSDFPMCSFQHGRFRVTRFLIWCLSASKWVYQKGKPVDAGPHFPSLRLHAASLLLCSALSGKQKTHSGSSEGGKDYCLMERVSEIMLTYFKPPGPQDAKSKIFWGKGKTSIFSILGSMLKYISR